MRGFKTLLSVSALFASAVLVSGSLAPAANAQVVISVQPNCPYGYYDYAPYACSPMGYYGSGYFYNGIFLAWVPGRAGVITTAGAGIASAAKAADAITAAAEWQPIVDSVAAVVEGPCTAAVGATLWQPTVAAAPMPWRLTAAGVPSTAVVDPTVAAAVANMAVAAVNTVVGDPTAVGADIGNR